MNGTIFYFDVNKDCEILQESFSPEIRIPNVGEKFYMKECEQDHNNSHKNDSKMKIYKVVKIETYRFLHHNRGGVLKTPFDTVYYQYYIWLKLIKTI